MQNNFGDLISSLLIHVLSRVLMGSEGRGVFFRGMVARWEEGFSPVDPLRCHLVAFAKLSNSFSSIWAAMKALPLAIKRPNLKEDHPNLSRSRPALVQLSFALSNVLTSVLCRRPLAVHPVQLRPANLCGWNPKTPKRFANHTM